MGGDDHRPAEGHVCIFDFDNGVNDTLQEELRACNVTDWFTHGKSLRGIERGLCPNIGTDEYLQFTNTGTGNQTCVEVKALMMGTGQDNPKNIHDILMADCTMYDRCPDNGLSPASDKQNRPPIGVQDVTTCAGGSSEPAAGVYPDIEDPERLRGQVRRLASCPSLRTPPSIRIAP